ncbi:MAG: HigA family addiction module antitoxin [Bacillota bacterium]|nr:HigA family addiction module antitoxin [Bacillota bacterium]
MSNYIEFDDRAAFHPGYYIKEIVDESGLTQEDFARRLGTTPKNLSVLLSGKQSLSIDIAGKLARMLGTTITYWLNLQQTYDIKQAEFLSLKELEREKDAFKLIDYKYFREHFNLPDLPRNIAGQIKSLRDFLLISSLSVLEERDLAISFRSYSDALGRSNIVNANAMVQVAINMALKIDAPRFNRKKFDQAVAFALTQTKNHSGFLPIVQEAFREAGVILIVLPNLKNSGINGATKKLGQKVLLMLNDRRHYADTFWFTLFHEIGHILHGDFGITLDGEAEDYADRYAREALIPQDKYEAFTAQHKTFDEAIIRDFADSIDQDPGIVFGRLQKDGKIPYTQTDMSKRLRTTYTVRFS